MVRSEALLACLLLAAACSRKAPGPVECVSFAERALGRLASRASYEELVRQCLTTPFDYAMLACVERNGTFRACRVELELRNRRER